jgi:hypothetical protein
MEKEEADEHIYRLCLLAIECPPKIMPSFPVEAYIREAMTKFPKKQGELWCTLGTFFVRIGDLERAEEVFEESLRSVSGARDFAQVFEAYSKLEESLLRKFMAEEDAGEFMEKTFINLERLLEDRPLLLLEARLRQLPNKMELWLKKLKIIEERMEDVVVNEVYEEAIGQIRKRGKDFI